MNYSGFVLKVVNIANINPDSILRNRRKEGLPIPLLFSLQLLINLNPPLGIRAGRPMLRLPMLVLPLVDCVVERYPVFPVSCSQVFLVARSYGVLGLGVILENRWVGLLGVLVHGLGLLVVVNVHILSEVLDIVLRLRHTPWVWLHKIFSLRKALRLTPLFSILR